MDQLTIETIDRFLEALATDHLDQLDLGNVRFVDPYALLLLRLLALEREEQGYPLRIFWPQAPSIRQWMRDMGMPMTRFPMSRAAPVNDQSALQPITEIENEEGIGHVVDGFHDRLASRYPLTEASRRALVAVMIELFQNIPHHSNATGVANNPHGIAAMQDDEDSIFLAVADKGIGLASSLGLRDGYENLSDAGALDVVFHQGASRFDDPGRGGELRRIADLVHSWNGSFALRSGCALYYFDSAGGNVIDVPHFPGVQLGLRIPRQVFV
ncbi:hypothetical protein KKG90_03415 [Candidatus Bipolaricaulota bacterium]|nr:hypothetical protein [Candidatus Bipolaricaulota bacterium]